MPLIPFENGLLGLLFRAAANRDVFFLTHGFSLLINTQLSCERISMSKVGILKGRLLQQTPIRMLHSFDFIAIPSVFAFPLQCFVIDVEIAVWDAFYE